MKVRKGGGRERDPTPEEEKGERRTALSLLERRERCLYKEESLSHIFSMWEK